MTGTGSPATIWISAPADQGCCIVSDVSDVQPLAFAKSGRFDFVALNSRWSGQDAGTDVNEASAAAETWTRPDAIALKNIYASADNSPDSVGSIAAPMPSTWTALLIGVADFRARASGGP
jgi:hypothetical protein